MKKLFVCLLCLLPLLLSAPLLAQEQPTLLISEVFYNAPGRESDEEWLEIANLGATDLDLSGYKIGDEEDEGGLEGMSQFPAGAVLPAGAVVVIAQNSLGFAALFGQPADYELNDSDPAVPDMRPYLAWATGNMALSNEGDEIILLDGADQLADLMSYGDSQQAFIPAAGGVFVGQSVERVPAGCDTNTAADWQPQLSPTPGQITLDGECHPPTDTGLALGLLSIGQIQGQGNVSPYVNEFVSFQGIVTGQYEDQNAAGTIYYTLFVQDVPGRDDGDPLTSDGIAIFLGRSRPDHTIGDLLLVRGLVTEFFGFTEVDYEGLELTLLSSDNPLPVAIPLPAENPERLEAMLVTLPAGVVVNPTYAGCGLAVVPAGTTPTRIIRQQESDPIGQIIPVLHNSDVHCADFPDLKSGDQIAGLSGPFAYNFDFFRIVNQDPAGLTITSAPFPPLPTPPTLAPHQFSVASFNVENYFDTQDDTGDPSAEPVPTAAELAVKQAKLVYAIAHNLGCPTLVGIVEVEKELLLLELAEQLTASCGFTYQVSHRESADGRGIDVALLSDPGRVTIQNIQLRQSCTVLNTGITDLNADCAESHTLFSRPPIEVTMLIDGQPHIVYVNHFKSKRGGADTTGPERIAQAEHINELVEALLSEQPQARIMVIGDFNDYFLSPTLQIMTEEGPLDNALGQVAENERYSYIFSGASQLIDGLLLSPALVERLVNVQLVHVNADFPDNWQTDITPDHLPYRSTDHDLPLMVLQLDPPLPTPSPIPPAPPTATPIPPSPANTSSNFNWLYAAGGFLLAVLIGVGLWKRSR